MSYHFIWVFHFNWHKIINSILWILQILNHNSSLPTSWHFLDYLLYGWLFPTLSFCQIVGSSPIYCFLVLVLYSVHLLNFVVPNPPHSLLPPFRSECKVCRYAWKIKEEKEEHEGADSSSSHDASNGRWDREESNQITSQGFLPASSFVYIFPFSVSATLKWVINPYFTKVMVWRHLETKLPKLPS